jgi:undecaprenyl diphosphate synthase
MKQSSLHVALIMDGNGRWASRRGLPRIEGHRAGAESLRRIVETAPTLNIGMLTVYAFSADNWKRPPAEVCALMFLLSSYLRKESSRLRDAGVRTSVIGRRDRVPPTLLDAINDIEDCTRYCSKLHLRLAIDYSARAAILEAARDEAQCANFLVNALPVDLLIRTGGEQRLSDFLLWESAYAELIFTKRMWPEFSPADLRKSISEYLHRDRRFGAVPDTVFPDPGAVCPESSGRLERWLR